MRKPSSSRVRLVLVPLGTVAAVSGVAAVLATAAVTPPPPRLPPEGGLSFDVRDAKTGEPIPCKLTLVGVDGTPDPEMTRIDIGRQEGDAITAYNRIMSLAGVGAVHVPVGTYDVTVSRGPEWDIATLRRVKVKPTGAAVT